MPWRSLPFGPYVLLVFERHIRCCGLRVGGLLRMRNRCAPERLSNVSSLVWHPIPDAMHRGCRNPDDLGKTMVTKMCDGQDHFGLGGVPEIRYASIGMPFQFGKTELLDEAIQRVFRECIGQARGYLRRCDRPAAVHGVRKEIKKLRAMVRLVQGDIGEDVYRKDTKALRRVADGLTMSRDAHIRLKAFLELVGRAQPFVQIEAELRRHCRRATRRFRKSKFFAEADWMLRKIGRRMDDLKFQAAGWPAIEPGLRQIYHCGRDALHFVRQHPSPENFHEWRKHVKDLWYCFQLLQRAWPATTRAMTRRFETLGELLGSDHDLVLLRRFVAENCDRRRRGVSALDELIEARQQELRGEALKLGLHDYAETPAALCGRLGRDWSRGRRK